MKLTGAILAAFCPYVFSVEEPGSLGVQQQLQNVEDMIDNVNANIIADQHGPSTLDFTTKPFTTNPPMIINGFIGCYTLVYSAHWRCAGYGSNGACTNKECALERLRCIFSKFPNR